MHPNPNNHDYVDIQQIAQVLKRRWFPASIVMGAVLAFAMVMTSTQKPIYESEGKLRFVKDNKVSSLSGLSQQMGEMSGLTNLSNPLETESEIIRSTPLIQKTIDELQLKGKDQSPLTAEEFLKRLKVKTIRGTDLLSIIYLSQDPKEAASVVDRLTSNYLESNVRSTRAEAVAAREFITRQLPEVETRVIQAEQSLRQFKEENNVVALDEEAKVIVTGLNGLTDRLTTTQTDLAAVTSQISVLQNKLGVSSAQGMVLTSLSQSNAVQGVVAEYRKAQDELALQQTRYTDEHPSIVNLKSKVVALKSQLDLRVNETIGQTQAANPALQISKLEQDITADLIKLEAERLGLQNRVNVLGGAMVQSRQRADVLPRLEQNQRQLERGLQVARSTYEELLKRLQEVQVIENQNVGNVSIVSSAIVPKRPISPKTMLNLMLGGFASIMLGTIVIWLLEALDKSVKTMDEAKQLLPYPVLGQIPRLSNNTPQGPQAGVLALPLRDQLYSPANVAFEMLQTSLGFTVTDKPLKVLTVTSALPNEGKSFVAANLAIAAAQMGQKVLLIDADMRCPTQHKAWELHNLQGLSDVLVGQADASIRMSKVMGNLYVLTAGTIPPNPTALLNSQRLADLVAQVSQDFDFVIIDTPPISVVADGLLLGKLADGLLMVVRPGTVNSTALINARNHIEQSGVPILGMTMNGINAKMNYGGYYYMDRYQNPQSDRHQESELPTQSKTSAEVVLKSLIGPKSKP
jgi:polysaccharide biosynthesis transport protein